MQSHFHPFFVWNFRVHCPQDLVCVEKSNNVAFVMPKIYVSEIRLLSILPDLCFKNLYVKYLMILWLRNTSRSTADFFLFFLLSSSALLFLKNLQKHQAPTREVRQTTPGIKSPHGWMDGFTNGHWCFHRSKDCSMVRDPDTREVRKIAPAIESPHNIGKLRP